MRKFLASACVAVALATPAFAQENPSVEVGTSLGVSLLFSDGGDWLTVVGVPGTGALLGITTLYVSVFPLPEFLVEPQVHLQVVGGDGETSVVLLGVVQVGYLFTPLLDGSPFVAAHGGALYLQNRYSETSGAFGVSLGYRWRVGSGGAVRIETRYRRWIEEYQDLSELTFSVGLGGIFSSGAGSHAGRSATD